MLARTPLVPGPSLAFVQTTVAGLEARFRTGQRDRRRLVGSASGSLAIGRTLRLPQVAKQTSLLKYESAGVLNPRLRRLC